MSTTTLTVSKAKAQPPAKKMGRPELPGDVRLIQRSIRMTEAQWAVVDQHGLTWLRELVEGAEH